MNSTPPPSVEDYDENFLKNMTDEDYIEFVAQFLRPTPIGWIVIRLAFNLPQTFSEWVFVGVYLFLMLIGVVGNCLVVYVVLRNKAMVSLSTKKCGTFCYRS